MPEFDTNHERQPASQKIEHAARYLQDRLKETGSFENLILALQHDYSGDLVAHPEDTTKGERIMGEDLSHIKVGARETYEDGSGAGQLYQLLRIANYIANPDGTMKPQSHAFYAGELLAMSVVDFVTSNENNVPSAILGSLAQQREEKWKKITKGFPTTEQNYLVHKEVSREIRQNTYDFSVDAEGKHLDMKALLALLTDGIPVDKASYIEGGYWLIMKEWVSPDALSIEQTMQAVENPLLPQTTRTREALIEAAKRVLQADTHQQQLPPEMHTTTAYDELMADFEMQFNDNELDFDVTEWNRESLDELVRRTVYQSVRIRAASSLRDDETDPAVAHKLTKILQAELNSFVRNEFEIDEDDLIYAHGTFVGLANSTLPLAEYDENGTLKSDDRQFAYQAMTTEDYRAVLGNPRADIVPYEVRGTFDKIVITTAVGDKESYTTDIDSMSTPDGLTFDSLVPAMRIINASIVDMRKNIPVEHIHDMVIPFTHSHLKLGRFVPPADDDA